MLSFSVAQLTKSAAPSILDVVSHTPSMCGQRKHVVHMQVHSPAELKGELLRADDNIVVLMCKATSCRPCKVLFHISAQLSLLPVCCRWLLQVASCFARRGLAEKHAQ